MEDGDEECSLTRNLKMSQAAKLEEKHLLSQERTCCHIHEKELSAENITSGNSFSKIYFSPTVEEILLN